jgi:hypothetical protein
LFKQYQLLSHGGCDGLSLLNNELHQVPGVERTQTFVILKMHELSYRWDEAEIAESQRAEDAIPGAAGSRENNQQGRTP